MRRILLWALSTVAAVVLLFGYRTSTSSTLPLAEPAVSGGSAAAPGGSTAGSGTSGSSGGAAGNAAGATTVAGSVAQTRWGPVQVQITVAAGKITAVDVVQYPDGNHRDQEINAEAVPTLVDETLQAQNADIDMVSGATVTSDGYLQSLQSALDQAHLA